MNYTDIKSLLTENGYTVSEVSNEDGNVILLFKSTSLVNKRIEVFSSNSSLPVILNDSNNNTISKNSTSTSFCLTSETAPIIVSSIIIDTVKGEADITQAPLDIVLLQDLSGSYSEDVEIVRSLVPSLVSSIQNLQPDLRVGVASFVDKPHSGFGEASAGDYVYKTELPLTSDITGTGNLLQATINNLTVLNGGDTPESQIEALMYVALRKEELGYRDSAIRVAILFTDADYHVAGNGLILGLVPNNGDSISGELEDYPSILQVKNALTANDVYPIFAVTSDAVQYYTQLVELLGRGVVVTLSSDSSNIINAVTTGLTNSVISLLKQPITGTTSNIASGTTLSISLKDKNNYTVNTTAVVKFDGSFEAVPINLVPLVEGMLVITVTGVDVLNASVTNTFYLNFEH